MKNQNDTMNVFSEPREKGFGEWGAFDVVRDDTVSLFRVKLPKHPIVMKEGGHILRIVYPYHRTFRGAYYA